MFKKIKWKNYFLNEIFEILQKYQNSKKAYSKLEFKINNLSKIKQLFVIDSPHILLLLKEKYSNSE